MINYIKMENKKSKFWKGAEIILTIGVFLVLLYSIQTNQNNIELMDLEYAKLSSEYGVLKTQLENSALMYTSLQIDQRTMKYTLADAWFSLQPTETTDKFEKFYDEHEEYNACPKKEIDVRILKNWYTKEKDNFNLVVIDYETGSEVYYKDGAIKCYPPKIENMYPEDIPCEELCQKQKID